MKSAVKNDNIMKNKEAYPNSMKKRTTDLHRRSLFPIFINAICPRTMPVMNSKGRKKKGVPNNSNITHGLRIGTPRNRAIVIAADPAIKPILILASLLVLPETRLV